MKFNLGRYFGAANIVFLALTAPALSEPLRVTFEVDRTLPDFLENLETKKADLEASGFTCKIRKEDGFYVLLCNETDSLDEMERTISILKRRHMPYKIIHLKEKKRQKSQSGQNAKPKVPELVLDGTPFYFGYRALDKGEIDKALKIFSRYYRYKPTAEYAYGYALALMKKGQYDKALKVLAPYQKRKKHAKLSHDIAVTQFYNEIRRKHYQNAHAIVKKHLGDKKAYHRDVEMARLRRLEKSKKFDEAEKLAKNSPYLSDRERFNIHYLQALALAKKKEYERANTVLKPYINRYKKAKTLYFANLKAMAGDLLKKGHTAEAMVLLKPYAKEPAVQKLYRKIKRDLLIEQGWSAFHRATYDKALEKFRQACELKENSDCLEGKMQSYYKLDMYERALKLAKKIYKSDKSQSAAQIAFLSAQALGEKETAQHYYDLLKDKQNLPDPYLDDAITHVDRLLANHRYFDAEETLLGLLKKHPDNDGLLFRLFSLYIETGRYEEAYRISKRLLKNADEPMRGAIWSKIAAAYDREHNPEALAAYRKAIQYQPDDFGLRVAYLYAIKTYGDDQTFEKEWSKTLSEFPEYRRRLTAVYDEWAKDRLNRAFKNGDYKTCTIFGEKIDTASLNRGEARQIAWCAFKNGDFEEAKSRFAAINYRYGESPDDIYGFALSAYRNGDNKAALQALALMEKTDSARYRQLIASLYTQIQDSVAAKRLILSLPKSESRTQALIAVNRSFTYDRPEHAAAVGFYRDHRSGRDGTSNLDIYAIPLTYQYTRNGNYKIYAHADFMSVSNGPLKVPQGFAFNDTYLPQDLDTYDVLVPAVGFSYGPVSAEIGTTPLGADIDPELTWQARAEFGDGPMKVYFQATQESIDESMISFTGDKAYIDDDRYEWGRVVKRGYQAGIAYDTDTTYLLELGIYPDIYGHNVIDNHENRVIAMAVHHFPVEDISYLDIGLFGMYDSFKTNTLAYNYGHGGYFSPQDFWMGSVIFRFGDIIDRFYYQALGSLGYETYNSDDMYEFPLTKEGLMLTGIDDNGVAYKGAVELGYRLGNGLDLVGGYFIENMYSYTRDRLGVSLVYRLHDGPYVPFNSFNLTHRLKKLIW
ncbi:MAG: tetratricopeptide repeat protein [Epsilonproteobacteria bacterium]|nr:tetratricopeptide repeat protein [Campylobacterota bacterium]